MVGVPADRAADMEHDLRAEEQERGNLVIDILGRMVVAGVEGRNDVVLGAVGEIEVAGAHRVAFKTDAEKLRLEAVLHMGIRLREDFVEGFLQQLTVLHPVDSEVLAAVMDPDVQDAGIALAASHHVRNGPAALRVLDPEGTDLRIRIGQGEVAALRVGEGGGIEIQLHPLFGSPLHPALEMFGADLVTVDELAAELAVDLMQVEPVSAGYQGGCHLDVGTEFFDVPGLAGIVAGGLDAAGEGAGVLEAGYVVGLPAMEGNLDVLQLFQGRIGVDAQGGIALFCDFVRLEDELLFHID